MESTNIVRKLDKLGRIVIPKKLRNEFKIDSDTGIEIFTNGELIILEVYQNRCCLCSGTDGLIESKGKWVCKECMGGCKKKKIRT